MSTNIFIGRKDNLQTLSETIFFPPDGQFGDCLSICGPHGIGKTFLIDHLRTSFEMKCRQGDMRYSRCFYLEIFNSPDRTLIDFQNDLIELFRNSIDEDDLDEIINEYLPNSIEYRIAIKAVRQIKKAYSLPDHQPNKGAEGYDNWMGKISRSVQPGGDASLFYNYTLLGFRIIIIIDEFDRAAKGYPQGDIFMWLFSLSNKSSTGLHLNLSIVLLSRKRANRIAHHMEADSNFESAYPVTTLGGFNNEEIEQYFDSYKQFENKPLEDAQKRQILYLCGRHPGLLMDMRSALSKIKHNKWDINAVWRKNPGRFKTVYEKMCTQLQAEKLSKGITLMDAVLYQFEFFVGEDRMFDEILRDTGFATELNDSDYIINDESRQKYYKDIFVLTGEKELESSVEPLKCEPLSPYFLEYIRKIWQPDQQKGVADYLEITERSLRMFIKERLQSKYPSNWKEIAKSTLSSSPKKLKQKFLDDLQTEASLNGYTKELSILDVMSFDNYYAIINQEWDLFQPLFASYRISSETPLDSLAEDMNFLVESRNQRAHGNIKILNSQTLERIKKICNRLNEIISNC